MPVVLVDIEDPLPPLEVGDQLLAVLGLGEDQNGSDLSYCFSENGRWQYRPLSGAACGVAPPPRPDPLAAPLA